MYSTFNSSISSFLGLTQCLPVTSYIKMIDIWMLFTMTVPFLEVVLHTKNEVFNRPRTSHVGPAKKIDAVQAIPVEGLDDEEEKPKTSNVLGLIGRLLLPFSSFMFMIIFWIVGLIASYPSDVTQDSNMTDCLAIELN